MCDGEGSVCACSFGVHASFRDDFSVEVGEFFDEPWVLHGDRSGMTCSLHILIVGDGPAVFRCEWPRILLLVHGEVF